MAAHHLAHEGGFGAGDVGQILAGLRARAEGDEIDRMALAQCDAHLAVGLEAADAGAMAGARVDDDVGAAGIVDDDALGRQDLQQHVVAGIGQVAPVHHHFVIVDQHRRAIGRLVLKKDVAALAQRVGGQHGPFSRIPLIFEQAADQAVLRLRPVQPGDQVGAGIHQAAGACRVAFKDAVRMAGRRHGLDFSGLRGGADLGARAGHAGLHDVERIALGAGNAGLKLRVEYFEDACHGD